MSTPTVLLLDDDEVLRQVLRRVLSRQGLNVVEAGDLAQARQVLSKQDCKLGLFDLCLPDGDGVELAKELEQSGSHMPLILMTAYPLRLREQPDLAQRFTRVLSKPVNLQELRETVNAALAGNGQPVPTPAPSAAPQSAATQTAPAVPAPSALLENPPPIPPHPAPPLPVTAAGPPAWNFAGSRGYLRPVLVAAAAAVVLAAAILLLFPETRRLLDWNKAQAGEGGVKLESIVTAKPVEGDPNAIELSREVVEQLKVKVAAVNKADAHRPLQLAGSLALDPDRVARVRSRFPGEVIQIADIAEPNVGQGTKRRPLQFGDRVNEDQFLGIVYSKDLGEKKSELVDAISQLRLDEGYLEMIEALYKRGATTEVVVRQARRNVEQDQIAVARAERTLRTWQLPEEEIEDVKKEAEQVIARKGQRDKEKEKSWARVDLKAPITGTIVEKNFNRGEIVDTTTVLFQIADMSRMKVWVNVPEEDLPVLREAQEQRAAEGKKLEWKIIFSTDPTLAPATGQIEAISPLIDPTQHTAIMMGWVNNEKGYLRSSQFVTATIEPPAPKDTVAIPTAALLEDGTESVVFVQPDRTKPVYSLRRVVVTKRFNDVAHIKSALTAEEVRKGYSALTPGELVVTQSALMMRAALDDVKAKAKP
jgi:cobalt-zinc-cadmium efflux system membrane fusion protein